MAEWREEEHPRKDDGEFTKKLNAALDKSSDELRNEQRREIRETEPTVVDAATGIPQFISEKEARTYYKNEVKKYADNVDFSGVKNVASMNNINTALAKLTAEYPTEKLQQIVAVKSAGKKAFASANGGGIKLRLEFLNNPTESEDWQKRIAPYPGYIETIQGYLKSGGTPAQKRQWKDKISLMKEEMKYQRWSVVDTSGDKVQAAITHEYGHVLADQIFGQINHAKYCKDYDNAWKKREWVNRVFAEVRTSGDIEKISMYANTDSREFFAECFAMRCAGEELPDNVEKMLKGVLGK